MAKDDESPTTAPPGNAAAERSAEAEATPESISSLTNHLLIAMPSLLWSASAWLRGLR